MDPFALGVSLRLNVRLCLWGMYADWGALRDACLSKLSVGPAGNANDCLV